MIRIVFRHFNLLTTVLLPEQIAVNVAALLGVFCDLSSGCSLLLLDLMLVEEDVLARVLDEHLLGSDAFLRSKLGSE